MREWMQTSFAIAAAVLITSQTLAVTEPDKTICGVENVEDMVDLPESPWIIGSGMGDRFFQHGGLHLINKKLMTARRISVDMSGELIAQAPYDQCPGPVPATHFSAHGLSLTVNPDATHNLYVVNHGARESIEIFKVTTTDSEPAFKWIGCVLTPKTATSNSVAARPDGSLVLSATAAGDVPIPSFHELALRASAGRGENRGGLDVKAVAKQRGAVYVWTRARGWEKVPNSELLGDNGIELSRDGQWAFVNSWPGKSVTYMPLNTSSGKSREVKLDFNPDNIRWSQDGKLVVTGHVATIEQVMDCGFGDGADCAIDYRSAEIDPTTLHVSPLFDGKGTRQFGAATIGLKTGGMLWLGSFRSSCIAKVRLSDTTR
ncbi:MAG: hypothetical protein ABW034_00475 [Steroidobacteraceae bacterium]